MRVMTVPAVLLAIGVGVAISLLFGDEEGSYGRELSRAEAEQRLKWELYVFPSPRSPARSPDSVTCRRATEASYECVVWFRGGNEGLAQAYGYDVRTPAHLP